MKAFVITLRGHRYSESKATRCIETAWRVGGIEVTPFAAVDKASAREVMQRQGLKWTWAKDNTAPDICPITGLYQHPYTGANLEAKIGCAMSHFGLWQACVALDEPILILEHDAVFVREFPEFEFRFACQINDPKGATPRGLWWSQRMIERGTAGVHEKTEVFPRSRPDGLAGNSAYVLKPHAALELIEMVRRVGVWPNDALMCRQLFPLEEYFPFITRVEQELSTSSA